MTNLRNAIPFLLAGLLLVGCSSQVDKEQTPGTPTPPSGSRQPQGEDPKPGTEKPEQAAKSDADIQAEIKEKLGRLTLPKTGYVLPTDADGKVKDADTLDEVAGLLRKKGYATELAKELTQEFYKSGADGVTIIPRDGHPGVFDPEKTAVFVKKNKYAWTVEQEHPDDQLHGAHVATYEVEVLKDGSYRLNAWKTKPM